MKSNPKPFSQQLFDECDPQSRRVVLKYFNDNFVTMEENPDKYGVDLISRAGFNVEIERRIVWKNGKFPFETVNLPERKAKFFKDGDTSYAIVSEDYNWIGLCSAVNVERCLTDGNLAENRNKFVGSGEYFYKIPANYFAWIKLTC
jgi:hypothetical protein